MVYTFYDIETNGLSTATAEILEFGYIQTDENFKILRSKSLYFWRDGWSAGRSDIHGLYPDMLAKYKDDFNKNIAELATIVQQGILIGKKSDAFDYPIVRNMLTRHAKISFECWPKPLGSVDVQDTFAPYYREYMGRIGQPVSSRKKGKLEEYMPAIGLTDEQVLNMFMRDIGGDRSKAHTAIFDAYMTMLVLKYQTETGTFRLI